MADCANCAAERARADAALLRLDKSVAGNHDLAKLHEAALARAEGAENRADAAERARDAWHEEAKNLEKFHDRSCDRAEAAEAAQAKLTEALRAAYAVNMRMLALYSPDMVGSKSGHSLMRSICEVNTTIDAILTSAASAPQAPPEDLK